MSSPSLKPLLAALPFFASMYISSAQAAVLQVGPERSIKTIAEASRRAVAGDIVEIDAGDYSGDVAVWAQTSLVIRAVGGRARLFAAGRSAEGKAIWVFRNGRFSVQGIEFYDTKVSGKNGAGIRFESGELNVTDCVFKKNENGILTSNNAQAILTVENSEFGYNGDGSGQTHNLYAGSLAKLTVRGSYFHHANVGHLLKSRAALNVITYNRLTDEADGKASYELEFPAGGIAIVVGNMIEQSATTQNSTIISYGAEGLKYPKNAIYMTFNTLADDRKPLGIPLQVKGNAVSVAAYNNLLLGGGKWNAALPPGASAGGNYEARPEDFSQPGRQDFQLSSTAIPYNVATIPANILLNQDLREMNLFITPSAEYVHPAKTRPLTVAPRYPGASQTAAK